MKKTWENDSCEAVQAYYTVYRVPVAAALWCGIAPSDIDEHLAECGESVKGIYKHPYINCLEPKCRAIHDAILAGLLPCSRENGKVVPTEEHVASERRHISRQHLKDWIAAQFPSDKSAFLFDDIERNTHTAINKDAYRALQAERDGLRARLEKAADEYRKLRSERDELVIEKAKLTDETKPAKDLGLRAETTYLNIIGGLVALFLMKSPAGKPHSVFSSQSALIDQLMANFKKPGITERTLQEKFASAKKSLDQ
jgi:hypothetical protein